MSESADSSGQRDEDGRGMLRDRLFPVSVPAPLEARITRSLYAAGYLEIPRAHRRWQWTRIALAAATIVLAFLAGYVLATRHVAGDHSRRVESREPRFALLLYASSTGQPEIDDVEEHRRWVAELLRGGHTVYGEKLASSVVALDAAGPMPLTEKRLEGFFVISAATEREALALARSLPHYKHGGRILVRRVEPT